MQLLNNCKKGRFFPIMISEGKHTIPLAFASDNNYAIPMCVAITSAFKTAHKNTMYDVHCLLSGDFNDENKKRLQIIHEKYPQHNIIMHDMGKSFIDANINIKHITSATYYRLKLASLLKDVNKCLYLDTDIIVNDDLSELFRTNIDDKYIAGVRAAGYYYPEKAVTAKLETLEISIIDQYVNAGVLLINLSKIRKNNLEKVFNNLLIRNFQSQDQDILNKACYNMIRILEPKYNAMTKYHLLDEDAYSEQMVLQLAYTKKEWDIARKKPVIIHYADKVKPWNNITVDYADIWWTVAADLPYFNYIFTCYFKNGIDTEILNLNNKLQIAYAEKSEINRKLQIAYAEKSEINRKLQIAYAEKSERGLIIKKLNKKLIDIQSGYSFRIGRVITFIPRKILGGVKCYSQHGLVYTIKRCMQKFKNFLK